MKSKLEQLLNSLIEKGWKPRGREKTLYIIIYDCDFTVYLDGGYLNEDTKSFRQLVSKESGLWQFVCENKLYKDYNEDSGTYWNSTMKIYNYRNYQYWLIESSLKDESELEDFLLTNIKVDE